MEGYENYAKFMRNAFLDIRQGGERLRSAPPKIDTRRNIITNLAVSYKPRARAQSGRYVAPGD